MARRLVRTALGSSRQMKVAPPSLWDAASGKLIGSFDHLGPISPGYAFLEAGRPSGEFTLVRTALGS